MILEKIKTPGLSHLSYLIGAGGKAAVIDPRRDCEIYVEKARSEGLRITHIFETHRNEDLVSGGPILAEMTGAQVFHGLMQTVKSNMQPPRERAIVMRSGSLKSAFSRPPAIPSIT